MVITTTIEQEKQQRKMFADTMRALRDRVHAEAVRVVYNKQYAYKNTSKRDDSDFYKFNQPYFTLDVPTERFFRFSPDSNLCDSWEFNEESELGMRLNFSLLKVKRGKCERGTTNKASVMTRHLDRKVTTKYKIAELKEMCKMNAIKVPAAAKYEDIVALLKTLP
jgi:hypothetical protein